MQPVIDRLVLRDQQMVMPTGRIVEGSMYVGLSAQSRLIPSSRFQYRVVDRQLRQPGPERITISSPRRGLYDTGYVEVDSRRRAVPSLSARFGRGGSWRSTRDR